MADGSPHAIRLKPKWNTSEGLSDVGGVELAAACQNLGRLIGDNIALWEPWGSVIESAVFGGFPAPMASSHAGRLEVHVRTDGVVTWGTQNIASGQAGLPCATCSVADMCPKGRIGGYDPGDLEAINWLCAMRKHILEDVLLMVETSAKARDENKRTMAMWQASGQPLVFE